MHPGDRVARDQIGLSGVVDAVCISSDSNSSRGAGQINALLVRDRRSARRIGSDVVSSNGQWTSSGDDPPSVKTADHVAFRSVRNPVRVGPDARSQCGIAKLDTQIETACHQCGRPGCIQPDVIASDDRAARDQHVAVNHIPFVRIERIT